MNVEFKEQSTDHEPLEENPEQDMDVQPFVDWHTISQFIVQVNKQTKVISPIYANGRQQVPIEIVIQARDADGAVVTLNRAQLEAIKLIEYETGAAVGNVSHTKDARYVYDFPVIREDGTTVSAESPCESDDPRLSAQTIMKYVHKNLLSTNWIAAEIHSPSGAKFSTNTPNPTAGKFDSWIKLRAQSMLIFPYTNLAMDKVNEVTTSHWDVDLYYIRFKDVNKKIVWSVHPDADANTAHSHCKVNGSWRFHVAYRRDHRRRVGYNPGPAGPGTEYYVNQRDGQATASRGQTGGYYFGTRHSSACMIYVDQHGNEARCVLNPNDGDDHNTMSLADYVHGTQDEADQALPERD